MRITVDTHGRLSEIPVNLERIITDKLTFQNPEWFDNQKMGRWQQERGDAGWAAEQVY